MSATAFTTFAQPWLEPISSESPSGRDARHEPDHEAVRAEIDKLASLSSAKPDWKIVEKTASGILTATSKDLQIACYLANAFRVEEGLTGLHKGFVLLSALVTQYGPSLFPQRARARASALEWFTDQTTRSLASATPESAQQATELNAAFGALQSALTNAYGADAPNLASLRSALNRLVLSAPAAPAPAPAPPPAATPGAPGNAAPAPSVSAAQSGGDAQAAFSSEALQTWLAPISASAPTGEDAAYADEYSLIRDEVAKLEAPTGQHPSWPLIAQHAEALLRTRSKDLTVAAYWAAALWETKGASGLALGLAVVNGLLGQYWEGLWPPLARVKRRGSALEWIDARMGTALANVRTSPETAAAFEQLEQVFRELERSVAVRFGQSAPSMRALSDALTRIAREREAAPAIPAPAAPADTAPAVPVQPSAPAAAAPALDLPKVAAPSAADLSGFLRSAGDALSEAGARVRAQSNLDPRGYYLARLGAWLSLDDLPAADAQGKTRIPPPDRRIRESLQGMIGRQDWAALLAQAEGLMARLPLWLDLQRFAALALEGLGPAHAPAKATVEREARHLLRRLPGLKLLRFSDNSPLADAETSSWLSASEAGAAANGAAAPEAGIPPELLKRLLRAEPEANAELKDLLQRAASGRAVFVMKLALADALQAANRTEAALALYGALEHELDVYQLERWEPELACQALHALQKALAKDPQTGWSQAELRRVCARLARIAPIALL